MSSQSCVLIAGGGTGGHVYPALATAAALTKRGYRPVFVGTARGLEARVVPEHGYPLELIRVEGVRGRGSRGLRALLRLPLAAWDALRLLRLHRPRAVVGVGGYASGPVVAMAALQRIPTLVEEQNVTPGTTNRILSRIVGDIALPCAEARAGFGGRGFVAGVPVRSRFFEQKKNRTPAGLFASSCSGEAREHTS